MYSERMPFGKHKGRLLLDVPTPYLCWVAELEDLNPWLSEAVHRELRRRGHERQSEAPRQEHRAHPLVDWHLAVLGQVRRRLALQHHPDRGGSVEKMQGINLALDAVEKELAGVA